MFLNSWFSQTVRIILIAILKMYAWTNPGFSVANTTTKNTYHKALNKISIARRFENYMPV